MSSKTTNALRHGTLDALSLKTLAHGPRHGYAVARFIEDTTGEAVLVEERSLYSAVYRLERRGWVEAERAQHFGHLRQRTPIPVVELEDPLVRVVEIAQGAGSDNGRSVNHPG